MIRRPALAIAAVAAIVVSTPVVSAVVAGRAGPTAGAATALGSWTTETPSGLPRQEVSYVTVGSKIYLAGGKSTVQQVFDPVAHTWGSVRSLPVALDHIQAVELNGLIYYVGGLDAYPGNSYGAVYVYNPAADTVSTVAPLPSGRDRGAGTIATYQGKIYLAGGFHTGGSVDWFDVYDPATNTWAALANMPRRRDHTSGAVVDGKFYVIGGRTYGQGPQPHTDVYDFSTGRWTTGFAPLPTLRAGAASAVFGTEILVIGGEGNGTTYNQVEAYETLTNTWRTLTPLPAARHGIQAAMYNGRAYIAGGGLRMGGGGKTDVQHVFSMSTTPPPSVRPDCRVRLLSESAFVGNNTYGTDGTGQMRSVTAARGATVTFAFSAQNDSTVMDSFTVQGTAGTSGFTARYLSALSGTTDITTSVVAGTYQPAAVAAGGSRLFRLRVQLGTTVATGASRTFTVSVTSRTDPSVRDVCAARIAVS